MRAHLLVVQLLKQRLPASPALLELSALGFIPGVLTVFFIRIANICLYSWTFGDSLHDQVVHSTSILGCGFFLIVTVTGSVASGGNARVAQVPFSPPTRSAPRLLEMATRCKRLPLASVFTFHTSPGGDSRASGSRVSTHALSRRVSGAQAGASSVPPSAAPLHPHWDCRGDSGLGEGGR